MPNISDVCARIDAYTDRLSTQVRTLAVGLLAFAGGLIVTAVTGGEKAPKIPPWLLVRLFFIGVAALLALACDLGQYAAMYWYMRGLQKSLDDEIRRERLKEPAFDEKLIVREYDENDPRFVAGRVLFGLKTLILLIAVLWLTIDAYILLRQGP